MAESFDVVVIGSGPGGYVAALQAARRGMKVACVERGPLGGVCLNWGCIPSKALLKSAEHAIEARHFSDHGIEVGEVRIDFPKVMQRSRKVAKKSEKGVAYLFKKAGVTHVVGTGRLTASDRVVVTDGDGAELELQAPHVIVATGARARSFPGMEPDGERILTYREAIVSERLPESVVILGAGAIGLEFAYFYNAMGAAVTLVEGAERIAPLEDEEVSDGLARIYRKLGVTLQVGVFCDHVERSGDGCKVHLKDGTVIEADTTLLALGVVPNTEGLGLEEVGVPTERGFVVTDASQRTSVSGVYAIGDVAGPPMLAHKASAEAELVIARIAGEHVPDIDTDAIPAGTFCVPQVASFGPTEAQLRDQGVDFTVGRFPFAANGKNRGTGHTDGFVKVLVGGEYGEILGAHILGDNATELLAELVLAKTGEVDAVTLAHTIHSHPTSGEAVMEAVLQALGTGVHL